MRTMTDKRARRVKRYGRVMSRTTEDATRVFVAKSARHANGIVKAKSMRDIDEAFAQIHKLLLDEAAGLVVRSHFEGLAVHPMASKTRFALDANQSSIFKQARAFLAGKMSLSESNITAVESLYAAQSSQSLTRLLNKAKATVVGAAESAGLKPEVLNSALDEAGVLSERPFLYETYARTQNALAFAAARIAVNDMPEIQTILWGYEYSATLDGRTRPTHAALDGLVLPKDHPRWLTVFPPNGYNCRCVVVEIFNDETGDFPENNVDFVEIDGVDVRGVADKGWEFMPNEILRG